MKNHNQKLWLAVLLVFALIFTMPACSRNKKSDENGTGMLETPTYLEGENPSGDDAGKLPNENLTGDETSPSTEQPTEEPADVSSEAPTEEPTEEPTEAPTEPEPSLEYKSFGNGTCSVVGIGDIQDLYVVIPEKSPEGDVVTTIESGAFAGNSNITVVQIPSTVYSIGDMAFSDCKSLVHIAVDAKNSHFCDVDGILFDIAQTTLICYPASKAATSLLLPKTLTTISNMALYGCDNLKMITFEGTVEQWAGIVIGEKNYSIYTASLTFSG